MSPKHEEWKRVEGEKLIPKEGRAQLMLPRDVPKGSEETRTKGFEQEQQAATDIGVSYWGLVG